MSYNVPHHLPLDLLARVAVVAALLRRFARFVHRDRIPPTDAAFLLRHFARVDIRVQLIPSDNVLLAVDFAVAFVVVVVIVVVVLPCRGPTAASLVVATVILFVLDSVIA